MTKAMMMVITTFVSRGLYFTLSDGLRVLYEYFTPREDAFVVTMYRCYYN